MEIVELALRSYGKRGHTARLSTMGQVSRVCYEKSSPAWRSYFSFESDAEAYIRERGSMDMDFSGNIHVDRILLDYEVEGDVDGGEKILTEIRHVIRHLTGHMDVDPTWLRVWFSGRRGFHLVLPDLFGIPPSPEAPDILKGSLEQLLDHPHLDLKPVFKAGLIRLEWTRHESGLLHKTPLLNQEIFSLSFEEIKALAADPKESRQGFVFPPREEHKPIWESSRIRSRRRRQFGTQAGHQIKYDPGRIITCMQHLVSRGARTGRRHADLLRLAAWMWRGGLPKEWAIATLIPWLHQAGGEPDEEKWIDTINRVYGRGYLYGCQDKVMAEFCDPRCIYFQKKNYAMNIDDPRSLARKYRAFLSKLRQGDAGFDLGILAGGADLYRIVPGEVLMISGDTGMAKTMFIQNLVTLLEKQTLWLNLEMSGHLNFRRFVQIRMGLTKREVDELFTSGSEEQVQKTLDSLDWLRQESIAPTLNEVEQMVIQTDPEIVVVDTTDAIRVPEAGTNQLLQLRMVMESLRVLAERYDVIPIGIHHITKGASRMTSEGYSMGDAIITRELTLNDLTGDRSNVTKVDHVFVIEGQKDTDYRRLRSLKTRDGSPLSIEFQVDWSTLRYRPAG